MAKTSSFLIQQSLNLNTSIHTSFNNTIMKNVLTELEAKDEKINALETKLDQIVTLLNSLVVKTNAQ